MKDGIMTLSGVWRNTTVREFVRYCLVGASGVVVDFGIYTLLTRAFGVYYVIATSISVFLAILSNFLLNKYWTFKKGQSGRTGIEYVRFLTLSVVSYFVNIGITILIIELTALETYVGAYEDVFAKACAVVVVTVINYVGNKYWTFRSPY